MLNLLEKSGNSSRALSPSAPCFKLLRRQKQSISSKQWFATKTSTPRKPWYNFGWTDRFSLSKNDPSVNFSRLLVALCSRALQSKASSIWVSPVQNCSLVNEHKMLLSRTALHTLDVRESASMDMKSTLDSKSFCKNRSSASLLPKLKSIANREQTRVKSKHLTCSKLNSFFEKCSFCLNIVMSVFEPVVLSTILSRGSSVVGCWSWSVLFLKPVGVTVTRRGFWTAQLWRKHRQHTDTEEGEEECKEGQLACLGSVLTN